MTEDILQTFIIQHIDESDPPSFNVIRGSDNKKLGGPYDVPSPIGYPVEGRPNSELMQELRWYLEEFLDYPYEPNTGSRPNSRAITISPTERYPSLIGGAV